MTDLLEQMKTRAEQAQTAYEAYKAECEKVEELPEVWYLWPDGSTGRHFADGCDLSKGVFWDHMTRQQDSLYGRDWCDRTMTKTTAAEYNNAKALYHGADFTGRLHEIDVPVCELNKATRDEMWGLPFSTFDDCYSSGGGTFGSVMEKCERWINDTYRLRAPKMRPMTRKEVLAWAASADADGWVVRWVSESAMPPHYWAYDDSVSTYTRAPIATLNDDGTGGEWEAFEVEA